MPRQSLTGFRRAAALACGETRRAQYNAHARGHMGRFWLSLRWPIDIGRAPPTRCSTSSRWTTCGGAASRSGAGAARARGRRRSHLRGAGRPLAASAADVARELRGLARADGPSERTAAWRARSSACSSGATEKRCRRGRRIRRAARRSTRSRRATRLGLAAPSGTPGTVHGADRPFQSAGNAPVQPEALFDVVGSGVPETAMPSFAGALSEEERWDLAFFTATLSHRGGETRLRWRGRTPAGSSVGARQLATPTISCGCSSRPRA